MPEQTQSVGMSWRQPQRKGLLDGMRDHNKTDYRTT